MAGVANCPLQVNNNKIKNILEKKSQRKPRKMLGPSSTNDHFCQMNLCFVDSTVPKNLLNKL